MGIMNQWLGDNPSEVRSLTIRLFDAFKVVAHQHITRHTHHLPWQYIFFPLLKNQGLGLQPIRQAKRK